MFFYKITQKVYDWYKNNHPSVLEKEDTDIYITDGEIDYDNEPIALSKRMFVGRNELGDTYASKVPLDIKVPRNMGDIQRGTNVKSLLINNNASVSNILDKIIFPVFAPVYKGPNFRLNIGSTERFFMIGDNIPAVKYTNTETASCSNPNTNIMVSAGNVDMNGVITYYDLKGNKTGERTITDDDPLEEKFTSPGSMTITYKLSYKKGTKGIKDSRGEYCEKYSLEPETLLVDAKETEYIEQENDIYVLTSRENVIMQSVTFYAYHDFDLSSGNDSGLKSSQDHYFLYTEGGIVNLESLDKCYIILPIEYCIEEFCPVINGNIDYSNNLAPLLYDDYGDDYTKWSFYNWYDDEEDISWMGFAGADNNGKYGKFFIKFKKI